MKDLSESNITKPVNFVTKISTPIREKSEMKVQGRYEILQTRKKEKIGLFLGGEFETFEEGG
jgi:hypothetical protein